MLRRISFVPLFLVLALLSVSCRQKPVDGSADAATPVAVSPDETPEPAVTGAQGCEDWVVKCLADFRTIQPGMTRAELNARFPRDGGLSSASTDRYLHPECSHFKVDVTFNVRRDESDQGRAIMSATDTVKTVSKPYLEGEFFD